MNRRDSGVLRHRHTSRFDKPPHTATGYPLAYSMRRPFPRRRILSNHFPSQSYRPILTQLVRPGANVMFQGPRNFYRPFSPQNPNQILFSSSPQSNSENSNPNTFASPHILPEYDNSYQKATTCAMSSPIEGNFQTGEELWIETLAPDGRLYYYNAVSRATRWEKPVNVRIMNYQQLQLFTANQPFVKDVLQGKEKCFIPVNQPPLQPIPPIHNFINVPPRLMFPPPNICSPPPQFLLPATVVDDPRIRSKDKATSSNLSGFGVACHEAGDSDAFAVSKECSDFALPHINGNEVSEHKGTDNDDFLEYNEQKEDFSRIEKFTPKSYFEKTDAGNDSEIRRQIANDLSISKEKQKADLLEVHSLKSDDDSEFKIGLPFVEVKSPSREVQSSDDSKNNKPVDKTRPVSSTPIPGTKWCVVWTGEKKVFFYDAGRKLSVWEIPPELGDRADVHKLLQMPPVLSEAKEVSSVSTSNTKKIKIDTNDYTKKIDPTEEIISTKENFKSCAKEKGNVIEIVLKASKDREHIPHETRIEMFLQMLSERKVSAFSTWEKELHKIVFDSRYLLLAPKERKQKFELYVRNKMEEEKLNRKVEAQTIRENFKKLLLEARVIHGIRFSEFSHRYGKDPRFRAVEKIKVREKLFDEYVRSISRSEEKRRDKFLDLLRKQTYLTPQSSWEEVKKKISSDEAYLNLSQEEIKESLFEHYIQNSLSDGTPSKKREERISASIQTRQEEVRRDLYGSFREMEKERELHRLESMRNGFDAMLIDLVRSADIKFRDAIKILKDDHRWATVRDLNIDDREYLFEAHVSRIFSKKREQFRQILKEMKDIDLKSSWRDVRKLVRSDARCAKFSNDDRKCEKEFKEYMRDTLKEAKDDFKDLMKETKIITYASKGLMKSSNHLEAIEMALAKDKRYLVLDCFHQDRKEMLLSYIEKLHKWGPPSASDLLSRQK